MSGLLDKANKTAKESEEIEDAVTDSSDAILDEENFTAFEASESGLNATRLKFQMGAVIGLIITMVLVFFTDNTVLFGNITLDDFFVPGLILWWLVFNGEDLMQQEFDAQKLAISGAAFLLVTGLFAGVAIFNATDSGVTIAKIEYDGEDDEIDLSFYGPKGMDYTVEVLVDGEVVYSHDATISIDKGSHSVSLDDFWNGNAEDMGGDTLVEYEIRVNSDGGEDSMTFDDIMNREIDTAFIKVVEKFTHNGDNKVYEGIYVEMIVGIGTPSANFDFENGIFTGTAPQPIESDWDATVRVLGGDAIPVYEFTADEGIANGYGDFNFNWVSLHPGGDYLEKGDFYGNDGCYTFEITIENKHGETLVSTDSQIEFFWDSNEASDGDEAAEAC